jgi:hypothetical protein
MSSRNFRRRERHRAEKARDERYLLVTGRGGEMIPEVGSGVERRRASKNYLSVGSELSGPTWNGNPAARSSHDLATVVREERSR